MTRALEATDDANLVRVVAMIDGLNERGTADNILAPLRPRIARLRLPRPIGFVRLLFQPFDPIIAPGGAWRRGSHCLPRTILSPVGRAVRLALGQTAETIDAALHGRDPNHPAVLQAGTTLWPSAAALLAGMPAPPDWEALTGLSLADYAGIRPMLRAVLHHAETVRDLADRAAAREEIRADRLRPVLADCLAQGPEIVGVMVALLLARLASPESILLAAARLGDGPVPPAIYGAVDSAVETTIERAGEGVKAVLSGPAAEIDLHAAGLHVARALQLLDSLAAQKLRPERAGQVETCRRDLETMCRRQFVACLDRQLLAPLQDGVAAGVAAAELECAARGLRHLQAAARRLGGASSYDAALAAAAARLAGTDDRPGPRLPLAERVRLTELLVGPEAALALLDASESAGAATA